MKPINKYIIVEKIKEEFKTESGLLLSAEDEKSIRYQKGVVIKSGTLVDSIKENDKIYFDKHAGHTVLIDDKPYTVILEKDVVVVL